MADFDVFPIDSHFAFSIDSNVQFAGRELAQYSYNIYIYIYVHSHSLRGCETLAPALDKRAPLPQTLVRCRQPLTKGRHGLSSRQRRGPALLKAKGGR